MEISIKDTEDGSKTLYRPDIDESYHSSHGALTESKHVFIQEGLAFQTQYTTKITLLEVGLGTGLNALLTLEYCLVNPEISVNYVALEPIPPAWEILSALDYGKHFIKEARPYFAKIHKLSWGQDFLMLPNFIFTKHQEKLETFHSTPQMFNLIYFDAFAPRKQEEMWALSQMEKCYQLASERSSLVTYCAMGQFRRNLKAAGFEVSKVSGPPGKREMTRAIKL